MGHTPPTKVRLTTTFAPLVMPLSGALARGVRLMDPLLQDAPTPQKMRTCEHELSALLREAGRRIMAWVLHHLEPANDHEAPSRVPFEGRLSRRRRHHPRLVATLFGPVTLWRRLDEPLARGGSSLHPLALRVGIEAGVATPALAERVGYWATDHTQDQGLERLEKDHGVHGSHTSLRTWLGSWRAGMVPHRHNAQVDHVVSWLEPAHDSIGRFRPTLAVGRDGIIVPLRHGVAQEGSTATISVLDRRGQRVGTVYWGPRPASGQQTLTAQRNTLLQDILSRVGSQGLRLVSVTDAGSHPRDDDHSVRKKRTAPCRPWRRLAWIRIVDFSHACPDMQQRSETLFGAGTEAQRGAQQRRQVWKTTVDGAARVLQSASALRRQGGLCAPAQAFHQAYA
jgi:hypothetical protein